MEFVFKVQEPRDVDIEIFVYVDNVLAGRLLFITKEWEALRAMLLTGNSLFQDKEASIAIEEKTSVYAQVWRSRGA
jgi:hypothetical protein